MINSSILSNKTVTDGKIDLLSNVLEIDFEKVLIEEWILVDEQTAMLLDLISFVMYGTEDHVDIIKKFNKINNPLSIQIGQIIAIPNINSLESNSRLVNQKIVNTTSSKKKNTKSGILSNTSPSKKAIPISNFIKSSNGNLIF